MRILLAIALLVAAPLAQSQTFTTKPFLSVRGHAEAKVKPDVFPVNVTLSETGTDPVKSQGLVEALATTTLSAAQAQGAQGSDIDVGNLSVSPKTKWDDKTEQEIFLGNTYERVIEVRFRDLERLRQFIAALPDSKQLRIDTGTFQFSGRRKLERELRREAVADAKAAAEDLASAVGQRLLGLFNVSDSAQSTIYSNMGYSSSGAPYPRNVSSVALLAPGTVRSAGIVLREGEITVSADAYLVYIIGD